MRKVSRIKVQDILKIRPGETVEFLLPTGKNRASGLVTAYKMPILHPRDDVARYKCKQLAPTPKGFPVAITAVPYDKE